jgi:hypothetical protein
MKTCLGILDWGFYVRAKKGAASESLPAAQMVVQMMALPASPGVPDQGPACSSDTMFD